MYRNVAVQGTLSHAEAHTTLHTNTHDCTHRLMHTSLCSCDRTGVTPARTYVSIQTQHLHPARTRSQHPREPAAPRQGPEQPHEQPAQAAPGVSRAPACTHAPHTLRLSPTPDAVCPAAWSDKTVDSQLDPAARLAAGTDTFPIPPKSPSAPPAHLHLTP